MEGKKQPPPASGIENPSVLDLVTHDPKTDEYALIMVETREWDDSDQQLEQLQAKINNYLHFALDGALAKTYPQATGKPVRIQVDCPRQPKGKTADFLARAEEAARGQGASLRRKRPLTLRPS